jgi:3-hydroxybutyryl-CoA dehydrogenase
MEIRTIGIVGAGQMGCGIAQVAAAAGYGVILSDIEPATLDDGLSSISRALEHWTRDSGAEATGRESIVAKIRTTTHVSEHARCDLVIETAVESFDIKAEIFRQLDGACPAEVVLASNTSSISITRLATVTRRPERVVGMHFMNPVPAMRLVEVVRGLDTDDATVAVIDRVARTMGKTPVQCNDHPGFVANRLLMPMINEAIFAVADDVASPEAIDEIMTLGANHPMGPLALADLIGLDSCLSVMRTLHIEFGDPKYRPCPLLVRMVDAGRLGRKSGRGFYTYTEG